MKPDEAYNVRVATQPTVHGDSVYFTQNWIEKDKYASSIYRFDGNSMERITYGNQEESAKWLGNSLYYIFHDKKEDKLIKIESVSGPREIYRNKSIEKYAFHGDSVVVITSDKADEKAPFVTSRIKYRYDSRGLLRAKRKLVLVSEKTETLVAGDFDVNDVASNGKRIVFSATKENDDKEIQDIYEIDPVAKIYKKITKKGGSISAICVMPDGTIAYSGNTEGETPWASEKLILPEKGVVVDIGKTAGGSITNDSFAGGHQSLMYDNGKLFLIGQEGGSTFVYSWSDKVSRITSEGMAVNAFSVASGKLAYIYSSPEKPSVIHFGGKADLNPQVNGRVPVKVETGGKEGWLILTDKRNPTILFIHGGPQSAYGYAYSIEFNFLADHGFNILYGNPRGSDGYGQDFSKGCVGDWGGSDMKDLFSLLDKAINDHSLSDVCAVTGGSYGGYMTNSIITKTNRFRCAVSERSISNLVSMCGTSDIGFWFNPEEVDVGDPWSKEGMAKLMEFSPISMVKNAKTPTMFIHGEEDYRCPIEQSEQMYTALRMNGVDSVLVRYQGDSHEHARRGTPKNMKDRLQRKLDWFTKYCK